MMRKYFSNIRNRLVSMGDPLSWSTTDKCILWIVIFPVNVCLWMLMLLFYSIHNPDTLAIYNMDIIIEICNGFWVAIAFFLFLAMVGFSARKRFPESRIFLHLTLQSTWIVGSVVIYLAGAVSSPAGATGLLGLWMGSYAFFDRYPVIISMLSGLAILVLTFVGSQNGLIPYAPMMIETPFVNGRLMTPWVIAVVGGCMVFIAINFVASGYIINRLRKREARLDELAKIDDLTRLYNRRQFFYLFNKEMSRSLRYKKNMAMILADIDRFKQTNDLYGHMAGDEALVSVADSLRSQLRENDVIARYGGEEFIMFLPETDLGGARHVAERCRAAVESKRIHTKDGHNIALTISLGVTICFVSRSIKPEDLIKRADESLYRAKNQGRNRVVSMGFEEDFISV